MKILRYNLANQIEMPEGAVILAAQPGSTGISIWVLCDPEAPKETRQYAITPTGLDLPDWIMDCRHITTLKGAAPTPLGLVPIAVHIFDVPAGIEIPAELQPPTEDSQPGGKPGDPADWWKKGGDE